VASTVVRLLEAEGLNQNEIRRRLVSVRFEVFTAVTVKNAVFWDVAPRSSCKNRRLGGMYHLCQAIHFSETSVFKRPTRRNIQEDDILQVSECLRPERFQPQESVYVEQQI
jgi:hypothetical protein